MTRANCDAQERVTPVLLIPRWRLPRGVSAVITTRLLRRHEIVDAAPTASGMHHFNLATHVGDVAQQVQRNRELLVSSLALPAPVPWLNQVHGIDVVCAHEAISHNAPPVADACISVGTAEAVCAVLTADCLPILLCSQSAQAIAAVHAGWRGLLAGVIEATLAKMPPARELSAYIGPAIGATAFEVGAEVLEAFRNDDPRAVEHFSVGAEGKFLADLAALAQVRLRRAGVSEVIQSGRCTVTESSIFYSHRAGQGNAGRFASLIWRNPSTP